MENSGVYGGTQFYSATIDKSLSNLCKYLDLGSGADNGLAVMTETVGMDINKYRYHLSLHNKFFPLATLDDDDGDIALISQTNLKTI